MKKVKICTQHPGGSTSFFRTIGVFTQLRKLDPEIEIEFLPSLDWFMVGDADVVVFERPTGPQFLAAFLACKYYGVTTWVDYDDDLFNIPENHPQYQEFQKPEIKDSIKSILELADVVTVTTEHLKKQFSKYSNNIHVVPNAFDDYHFQIPEHCSNNKIISWRGSDTHAPDLHEYEKAIWAASEAEPSWTWIWVGAPVLYITRNIDKTHYSGMFPLIPFYKYMKGTAPAIQHVPLVDNVFNRSKSNIGLIDGLIGGSVCVAPDMEEWRIPGVFLFRDDVSFIEAIHDACDKTKRESSYQLTRKYVIENLLLSTVNKKRIDILNTIICK